MYVCMWTSIFLQHVYVKGFLCKACASRFLMVFMVSTLLLMTRATHLWKGDRTLSPAETESMSQWESLAFVLAKRRPLERNSKLVNTGRQRNRPLVDGNIHDTICTEQQQQPRKARRVYTSALPTRHHAVQTRHLNPC